MTRFADLAAFVRSHRQEPCGHWVVASFTTMGNAVPRYSQCTDCGQVRRRHGLKPLIHNGKKRRKA